MPPLGAAQVLGNLFGGLLATLERLIGSAGWRTGRRWPVTCSEPAM